MRRIAFSALVVSVAMMACVFVPAASAALAIDVPAATLAGLAPGTTTTSAPVAIVVGAGVLENWFLHIEVASGARLSRQTSLGACAQTKPSLAAPLHASFSRLLPPTTIDIAQLDLGNAPSPTVAHGTGPGTVTAVFSQTVADNETLVLGCVYSMTVTYTASAT